jgi:aspartate/glutamate racemase
LVTGVVAGVILAYVIKAYNPCTPDAKTITCLSPAIIGILGGFSAEAVEQILQRLVDVLLSTIRGDNSGQIQAKATAQQTAKFADVRDKLEALDKVKGDPTKFQAELEATKALLKNSTSQFFFKPNPNS